MHTIESMHFSLPGMWLLENIGVGIQVLLNQRISEKSLERTVFIGFSSRTFLNEAIPGILL